MGSGNQREKVREKEVREENGREFGAVSCFLQTGNLFSPKKKSGELGIKQQDR